MDILTTIIENIDLMYIVSCNIATYFIITSIDSARRRKIKTWLKRLIAGVIAALIGVLMYHHFEHPVEPIFYGWFVQFITWDYLFKPFVKSLKDKVLNSDKTKELDD